MHHTSMGVLSATLPDAAGDQGHIPVQIAPHFSAQKTRIHLTGVLNSSVFKP
jgi:hypothetical protein